MAGLDFITKNRNLQDLVNDPKGYLQMLADRINNSVMGRKAVANRSGLGFQQLTPKERQEQIQSAILDSQGNGAFGGALGVIKNKGGNWLKGSVEHVLGNLGGPKDSPINKFVEGPLTKYVKNQMATPEDPVRKLAEQGILHFDPTAQPPGVSGGIPSIRKEMGFPMWGVGEATLAKRWEELSDSMVSPRTVEAQRKAPNAQTMPWLDKLAPEEYVYDTSRNAQPEKIGLDHLTDELKNALNPNSGLPRHLQLTPEQMQQMGMEKAVRHVADINAWRASQQAEANLAKSQSPAVHTLREYSENNPKGLKWVELKDPDPEHPNEQNWKHLEDQLGYEGDTMGHCVGGYCEDVLEGRSRIFSLRDAKGEPHVTIETSPNKVTSVDPENPRAQAWINERAKQYKDEYGEGAWDAAFDDYINEEPFATAGDSIVQIKGKQNAKPKDEYLPFVQDFVRNHPEGGQWGKIADFGNTGLERISDYKDEVQALAREKYPNQEYLSIDEIQPFVDAQFPEYAEGGLVTSTFNPDAYLRGLGIIRQG